MRENDMVPFLLSQSRTSAVSNLWITKKNLPSVCVCVCVCIYVNPNDNHLVPLLNIEIENNKSVWLMLMLLHAADDDGTSRWQKEETQNARIWTELYSKKLNDMK